MKALGIFLWVFFAFILIVMGGFFLYQREKIPDWGVWGASYVRQDAPFRHFTNLTEYEKDKIKYVFLLENKSAKYPYYIKKDNYIYILTFYGTRRGDIRYFYPSHSQLKNLSDKFGENLDKKDKCLGIKWLAKNTPMQVSIEKNWEIYQWEKEYVKNVRSSVGKFCDE